MMPKKESNLFPMEKVEEENEGKCNRDYAFESDSHIVIHTRLVENRVLVSL